jgi:hypothetical protein
MLFFYRYLAYVFFLFAVLPALCLSLVHLTFQVLFLVVLLVFILCNASRGGQAFLESAIAIPQLEGRTSAIAIPQFLKEFFSAIPQSQFFLKSAT